MFTRSLSFALLLSLAPAAAALAGEVTLYSRNDFRGREVTVREDTRDLRKVKFNDKAISFVIRSGRWEVCEHADYRGECRTLGPGGYHDLRDLSSNISSLREVSGRDSDELPRRGLTMFASPNLGGRSMSLRGDTPDFVQLDFNDVVQSMVIQTGTWELCEHADFGGACRVFGPGEYPRLDKPLRGEVSSARLLASREYNSRRDGGVDLFGQPEFGGERVSVRDEVRDLSRAQFNDRAGSLIVYGGRWEFCQHSEFRGQCLTYGPGRYDRLGSLHNAISSIRRVR